MANEKTTKKSDPDAVDAFLKRLKHPLVDLAKALRTTILTAAPGIGEEIKWNAPAFFFTGPMKAFDPKEYRRHLVVFNFYRKDAIRLVFWHGDRVKDKSGLLLGDYPDGRRLATFSELGRPPLEEQCACGCVEGATQAHPRRVTSLLTPVALWFTVSV